MPWRHLFLSAALASLGLQGFGCSRSDERTEQGSLPSLEAQPLAADESPLGHFETLPAARGREVIDVADDGRVLAGRAVPPAPRSSQRLVFEARYFDALGSERPLLWATAVQDARFAPAPSTRFAVLDANGTLRIADSADAPPQVVTEEAFPGFAFSHSGRLLAFSKGQAPELYALVVDLELGQETPLTQGGHPVWGFAFSPDDQWLVFVDSREGFPTLVTMRVDGSAVTRLTNRGMRAQDLPRGATLAPFPDGRRPPVWTSRAIWIEDATGIHAFDLGGRLELSRPGASELRPAPRGGAMFRADGRLWRAP